MNIIGRKKVEKKFDIFLQMRYNMICCRERRSGTTETSGGAILENGIEKRERIVSNLSEQVKALGGAGTEGLNIRV